MRLTTILGLIMLASFTQIEIAAVPTVTLNSCLRETASVTIENAYDGGIIYFRTDNAYNIIPSTNGTIEYECAFEDCNIKWDEKFYIVVQKKVIIQTSDDVIEWMTCNTDFSSISTIDFSPFDDMLSDNLTTTTYKPEVSMSLLANGVPLENQAEVKLGTEITMSVEITNNPGGFFDISPKSCYASGITLYEDKCPVSDDLMGVFNTTVSGLAMVTFGMFRPTSNTGGPVAVVFTCILEVCDGTCVENNCTIDETATTNSSVRRKRDTRDKDKDNPSVIRGFTLMVVTEETKGKTKIRPDTGYCMEMYLVVGIFGFIGMATIIALIIASFSLHRSYIVKDEIKTIKERQNRDIPGIKGVPNLCIAVANNQVQSMSQNGVQERNTKLIADTSTNVASKASVHSPTVAKVQMSNGSVSQQWAGSATDYGRGRDTCGQQMCSGISGKGAGSNDLYPPAMYTTYRRRSVTKTIN